MSVDACVSSVPAGGKEKCTHIILTSDMKPSEVASTTKKKKRKEKKKRCFNYASCINCIPSSSPSNGGGFCQ